MKKIRTFLAALTAVTMCVGAVPVAQVHLPQVSITASAEDLTYDNLTYRIEGDETKTVTITGCDKNAISIDIPAEIDGLPVTKIGTYAFQSHENLVKAIFPSSILTMGERVFNGDKSLRTVTLPANLKEMGTGTFSGCTSLKEISIPEGVASLKNATFSGCTYLTTVSIPESVTTLGNSVFEECTRAC